MEILGKKIKLAEYNPRSMSKDAKKALKDSMGEFEDISGIVINSRTGNVISGNHRWEILTNEYSDLNLVPITDSHFSIESKGKFTGFIVKVVDWSIEKEKAANITANSDLLMGTFTAELQTVLNDISMSLDDSLFENLRLDELQIDLDGLNDLEWDDSQLSKVQDEAEQANRELADAKGDDVSDTKYISETIKILVPSDLKKEIKDDLLEFLATKDYYGMINIT